MYFIEHKIKSILLQSAVRDSAYPNGLFSLLSKIVYGQSVFIEHKINFITESDSDLKIYNCKLYFSKTGGHLKKFPAHLTNS